MQLIAPQLRGLTDAIASQMCVFTPRSPVHQLHHLQLADTDLLLITKIYRVETEMMMVMAVTMH